MRYGSSEIPAMSQRVEAVFEYLDAVSAAIFIVQAEQIVWANQAAVALTGYDNLILSRMRFTDLLAPHWREREISTQAAVELELLAAQGGFIWVELSLKSVEFNGSPAEIITASNIRQRKHSEQREAVLRQAVEGMLDGFYLLSSLRDPAGKIIDFVFVDINERGRALLQMSKDQIIG